MDFFPPDEENHAEELRSSVASSICEVPTAARLSIQMPTLEEEIRKAQCYSGESFFQATWHISNVIHHYG